MAQKLERLTIGQVVGAFGVHGELKVQIETDFPERFKTLKRVFIGADEWEVEQGRPHKDMVLIKLKGVDTPEHAQTFARHSVEVALSDAVPLPAGKFFLYQIIGLHVETIEGETLGDVTQVLRTGANDVYIVTAANGKEILLPAIPQVIKQIDVEHGKMIVELMEGLR
jgi:16S rRNA processing protein RimM